MLLAISGCAPHRPKYDMPAVPLPAQYREAGGAAPEQGPGLPRQNPATGDDKDKTKSGWWREFESTELDALVDRALANNPDMRIALQRIVQSKARADQAKAGRLPSLSAPLVAADQSSGSGALGAAPTGSGSGGGGATTVPTFQGSVRADWRLDLWGEQSALAESAAFQLSHSVYERDNVERNLAAAIAASYVEYLSLNDRRAIAQKIDELQSATLTTVENRVAAGDATLSDLEQQRAAVYSVRATLPILEAQRMEALSNIAFLVGTVPGKLQLSERGLDSLAVPAATTGLPSELLLRRPDVRMAEAQLRGANADVAVARSRLLPPMDLAAQLGRSATSPVQLLQPQALFWTMVETLTVQIFDGGRKKNDEVYSRAVHEEMVEGYVRAARQAMKEVESALTALRLARERMIAQKDTLDASYRAWDISGKIYKAGGVDYLTLLDTQRTYHRYLDDYAQARMAYFRGYITLLQALAGSPRVEVASGGPASASAGGTTPTGQPATQADGPGRCLDGIPRTDNPRVGSGMFWQVQLAGDYHCTTVPAAWRDLQTRYPSFMFGRTLDASLDGRIEGGDDGEQSWYRLAVGRFGSEIQATEFCAALTSDQHRCHVVPMLASGAPLGPNERPAGGRTPAGSGPAVPGSVPPAKPGPGPGEPLPPSNTVPERLPMVADTPTRAAPTPQPAAKPKPKEHAAARDVPTKGRFLQLGAFRDMPKAEAFRARVRDAFPSMSDGLRLRHDGPFVRVLVGPFADAGSERAAAGRVRGFLGREPYGVEY